MTTCPHPLFVRSETCVDRSHTFWKHFLKNRTFDGNPPGTSASKLWQRQNIQKTLDSAIGGGRTPPLGAGRRFRALNINDKKETQNMSDENKKKVVLGTTLALLLGAGSYWFLGSGGGGNSDGLNSASAGPKVARVRLSDDSGEKEARRRPPGDRGRPSGPKIRRDRGATRSKSGKTIRPRHSTNVIRKKNRQPQA